MDVMELWSRRDSGGRYLTQSAISDLHVEMKCILFIEYMYCSSTCFSIFKVVMHDLKCIFYKIILRGESVFSITKMSEYAN